VRLLSNVRETPTTRRIRIGLDGISFQYSAGQAASLAAGSSESTPYSIASAPFETARHGWLEFLVKVDGSSRFGAIVSDLSPGTRMIVSDAAGSFTLPRDVTAPLLFVAGGTGIAPMRSMIREMLFRDASQRPSLLYSARSPEEFAYLEEFRELAEQGRLDLTLTLTGNAADWRHARGRAGAGHLESMASPHTLCFICGPPAMVTDVPATLKSLGVPQTHIRTEGW
jgi:ferredoxin-NADP reductase